MALYVRFWDHLAGIGPIKNYGFFNISLAFGNSATASAQRTPTTARSSLSVWMDLRGEIHRTGQEQERLEKGARRELRGEFRRALFFCSESLLRRIDGLRLRSASGMTKFRLQPVANLWFG